MGHKARPSFWLEGPKERMVLTPEEMREEMYKFHIWASHNYTLKWRDGVQEFYSLGMFFTWDKVWSYWIEHSKSKDQ